MKWTQTAPGESVDDYVARMRKSRGGAVAGVAGLVGGASLLGAQDAGAAEPLPAQRMSREALSQRINTLPPEKHQSVAWSAESFARIGKKTETKVRGAVSDLFALAKNPNAKPRYRSPKARELDRRAAELDVPRAVARFMGRGTDDPEKAWKDKGAMLQRVMADPGELARTMAQNMGDLSETQPEIFTGIEIGRAHV